MRAIKTTLFITLLLLSTIAKAQTFEIDGICYQINNKTEKVATALNNLNSETESIVIPETVSYNDTIYTVKFLGAKVFSNSKTITSITLPNSIAIIGQRAFSGCTSLRSINLPDSLKVILDEAFSECASLTNVKIPKSVIGIKYNAFAGCFALDSISVEEGNTVFDSRDNCNAIIYTEKKGILVGSNNTIIPEGIKIIGQSAFSHCKKITNITIPNSVETIGVCAFEGCTRLTDVTIEEGVQVIREEAFANCTSLKSITIPKSVAIIKSDAFSGCFALESIVVSPENTIYSSPNNCNAIIRNTTSTIIAGCKNTIIPDCVATIKQYAFANCSGLTKIKIPKSVETIGMSAFAGCTSLTDVTIEEGVQVIGEKAFANCTSLKSITIPASVTEILDKAFANCKALTNITIAKETKLATNLCVGCDSIKVKHGDKIMTGEEFLNENTIFLGILDENPEFPGGMQALMKYLKDNINYPKKSRDNNSQGKTYVNFVINTDGSIQDVEVMKSSGDVYLDKEAVRVVKNMPKWKAGKKNGKAVRTPFILPVIFSLK